MTMVDPASLASEPLLAAIAWSYLAINSTRIVTYVPQIMAAWRCTDGARAISLLTWGSWAVSHFSGLAYGTLVLHDAFFVAITTINLLGCCSVTAIVAAHRWRLRRRQPVAQTVPAGRGTPRHPPAWTGTARLLGAACAGALVAALWLQAPWEPAPAKATAAPPMAPLSTAALPPPDALRADATLGLPYATQGLVTTLLARYEAAGDQTALFEAMLVLDREWDQPEMLRSGLIQRVVQTYCPHEPLLRHFWMCDAGE